MDEDIREMVMATTLGSNVQGERLCNVYQLSALFGDTYQHRLYYRDTLLDTIVAACVAVILEPSLVASGKFSEDGYSITGGAPDLSSLTVGEIRSAAIEEGRAAVALKDYILKNHSDCKSFHRAS